MSNTAQYDGKVSVVTGAASGIGLATVRRLLGLGSKVVGGDINEEALEALSAQLGDDFTAVPTDVTQEADVAALVAMAVSTYGRLDAGFNVAGTGDLAPIIEMPEELWTRVHDITLKGVFFSVKHEARQLVAQGQGGAIVNIASINCRQPTAGLAAYSTAKAAVDMLTRSAAVELGEHGIRVNTISPGIVVTPATSFFTEGMPTARDAYLSTIPLGRFGDPDEIAASAAFLASDEAKWVSGANLFIDGAESLTGYPSLLAFVGEVPAEISQVSQA